MKLFVYIQQGGPIMYILLALNIIGFTIMLSKFAIIFMQNRNLSHIVTNLFSNLSKTIKISDQQTVIHLAKQEINGNMIKLERGLNTVKIIASIAPLLGLLGTVIGVLLAFQVISSTGMSRPENFAQGISMALITTVGGLIVSIPHYIGHSYLLGLLDRLEQKIEKDLFVKLFSNDN